jgi:hypothetical protein
MCRAVSTALISIPPSGYHISFIAACPIDRYGNQKLRFPDGNGGIDINL